MTLLEDLKKTVEKLTGWQRPTVKQLGELVPPWKIAAFHFKDDGLAPNHPRWPLLVLWRVVRAAFPRSGGGVRGYVLRATDGRMAGVTGGIRRAGTMAARPFSHCNRVIR
jgi:hypothetical protein